MKALGQLTPLITRTVGGKYEIGAGTRRFVAAQVAGLETLETSIWKGSDEKFLAMMHAENDQREDPDPFKQAELVVKIGKAGKNMTNGKIAKILGVSTQKVAQLRAFATIKKDIKLSVPADTPIESIAILARYPYEIQKKMIQVFFDWEYPEDVEHWLDRNTVNDIELKDAPFNTDAIYECAGPCKNCSKRTSCQVDLFDNSTDLCLDNSCFESKVAEWLEVHLKELKGDWKGPVVLISELKAEHDWYKETPTVYGKARYANRVWAGKASEENVCLGVNLKDWSTRYVHLLSPADRKAGKKVSASRTVTEKKDKPVTLTDKRKVLKNKRFAWAIDQVVAKIKEIIEKENYPAVDDIVLLKMLYVFGTAPMRNWKGETEWTTLNKLTKSELTETTWARIWSTICNSFLGRLNYMKKSTALEWKKETEHICQIFSIDLDKLVKEADQTVKEPKSWTAK